MGVNLRHVIVKCTYAVVRLAMPAADARVDVHQPRVKPGYGMPRFLGAGAKFIRQQRCGPRLMRAPR